MAALTAPLQGVPDPLKRPLAALALMIVAVLLLYRETATTMVGIWARSDTFAHAFLVPPISLWLIWRGRDRLLHLQPRPAPIWLVPLALAALAWSLGELVGANAVTQFALVAMLVLLVPLTLGWPAARVMLFPLLFLFFSVPVGEFLLPIAMQYTADFTVAALRLSGIPVYREGLHFVIPSGNWSVVEACSGIRYLIASMMVGSLFAYLNYQSLTRRLIFVGVSIVVPIVANWVRAYMIVMLGHLSDNRIATGVDHLVYGWVFFGVVIMIMFMIGSRWAEPDREPTAASTAVAAVPSSAPTGPAVLALAAALVILAAPHLGQRLVQSGGDAAALRLNWPLPGQAGWQAVGDAPAWSPKFVGMTEQRHTLYRRDGKEVGVYLAYYRGQGPDRKLVSSVNALVLAEDLVWNPVGEHLAEVSSSDGALQWRATHVLGRTGGLTSPRRHLTAWQIYWVDDRFTASDTRAKLYEAFGQLAGRGDDGAAIVLHTEAEPQAGGDKLLAEFVQAHLPQLREALRQARAGR